MKTSDSKPKVNETIMYYEHAEQCVTNLWLSMKGKPFVKIMESESDARNWLIMEFCEFLSARDTYIDCDESILLRPIMIDELLDVINFCHFYSPDWVYSVLISAYPNHSKKFITELLSCWICEIKDAHIRSWEGKQAKKGRLEVAAVHSVSKMAYYLRFHCDIKSPYTNTKLHFMSLPAETRKVYDSVVPSDFRSENSNSKS